MDNGDEWKYEARGDEVTPELAKRLAAQQARALIWCSKLNEEFPIEMHFMECAADGEYVRLRNEAAAIFGMPAYAWVASEAIRFVCVLPKQQPRQIVFEKEP